MDLSVLIPGLAGRNPQKVNASVESPEATTAETRAQAPGRGGEAGGRGGEYVCVWMGGEGKEIDSDCKGWKQEGGVVHREVCASPPL